MSKRFTHGRPVISRVLSAMIMVSILVGAALTPNRLGASFPMFTAQIVHAAEGCGTGSNSSYTMETYSTGGGQYYFAQDTCTANGTATSFRDRANDKDFCATRFGAGATLLSLAGLVVEGAGTLGGLGALFGFAIAGDCGIARTMLTGVANKIQKANQVCGTQGISYQMRARRASLEVFAFECQPTGDKSLEPDDTTGITAALVQGPQPDGGDACGTSVDAPYYTSTQVSDEDSAYYRDVYMNDTVDGSHTYQQTQWNQTTGAYDLDSGTLTRCTPEPTPEPTAEPTAEPTPEPTAEPTAEPALAPPPEPVGGRVCTDRVVVFPEGNTWRRLVLAYTQRFYSDPYSTSYYWYYRDYQWDGTQWIDIGVQNDPGYSYRYNRQICSHA